MPLSKSNSRKFYGLTFLGLLLVSAFAAAFVIQPVLGDPVESWHKYSGNPIMTCSKCAFGSTFYDNDTGVYHHFTSFGTVLHYTSSDGKSWVADDANNPVLTPSQVWEGSSVGVPMVWKEEDTWYMLYRGGSPKRIGLATSSDAVNWNKYSGNPVLTGTPGEWDDPSYSLDPWGIIKIGSTYYLWYNTISTGYTLGRCVGLATSTNLVDWTKDANNPIFTGGRFCAFPFKYGGYYYIIMPHYTSGTDYSQIELYRDSNPTFYPGDREYLGVAINIGPTDWDDHDQDCPCVLTDTVYRDTYEASNNELWVYYSGEGGAGWGQTGMCIEPNISEALSVFGQPDLEIIDGEEHEICDLFWVDMNVTHVFNLTDFEFTILYGEQYLECLDCDWTGSVLDGDKTCDYLTRGIVSGSIGVSTRWSGDTGLLLKLLFHVNFTECDDIWKDPADCPGSNYVDANIWFQHAKLSFHESPDLTYEKGVAEEEIIVYNKMVRINLIQGDVDCDGDVDVMDLRTVAYYYDQDYPKYDLNCDGIVDIFDLIIIAVNFGFKYP